MDRPSFEVAGNRLTLVTEGPEQLETLIALIDGARESLRLIYYIYAKDSAGERVRAALDAALGRGVAVSLIIDGFGSDAPEAFFAPLERDGAEVCRFIPRLGRRYLLRNHQKLALADGRHAMIGGFNIAHEYFEVGTAEAWRDLGLLVEGEAAGRLAGYFDALSAWANKPRAPMRQLRRALRRWSEPTGPVRWLLSGPGRRLSPLAAALRHDLHRAKQADIIAAYFAPNPAMLRRIERIVRQRGGDARILTASKSDNIATIGAARHCYRRLLARGVKVFEYRPSRLHTKLFAIDDAVMIGSANFDMRSLYLNLELMLRIEDAAFARHVRDYFEGELADSEEITREAHRARSSWLNRILWAINYFLVAVMDYNVSRRLNFGAPGD